jgi:hypothetical protein
MTPEQLQQYVDAALKQRNQFDLVFYPLVIILSLGGAWLVSYLREKGKNLATKEDVAAVTHTVEAIKADLMARQHFSQVRYERELKVYEELLPKLCDLQAAVLMLRPAWDWGSAEGRTKEEEGRERQKRFLEAHRALFQAINLTRPFFSDEVWEQLNKLMTLCWGEAVDWGLFSHYREERQKRDDYWEKAQKNSETINNQIDVVYESIRKRLGKFDPI